MLPNERNSVQFLGDRMFNSSIVKGSVLDILHQANQGVSGMKAATTWEWTNTLSSVLEWIHQMA